MIPGPFPQDNPGSGVKEGTEWGSSPRKQLRESLSPLHPSGVPECTTEGRRGVSGGGMGGERRSLGSFRQGITKTSVSNSSFASPRMNWRENSPVVQGYNAVLPLYRTQYTSLCTETHPWFGK